METIVVDEKIVRITCHLPKPIHAEDHVVAFIFNAIGKGRGGFMREAIISELGYVTED